MTDPSPFFLGHMVVKSNPEAFGRHSGIDHLDLRGSQTLIEKVTGPC